MDGGARASFVWEETGVPGENPRGRAGDIIHTTHRSRSVYFCYRIQQMVLHRTHKSQGGVWVKLSNIAPPPCYWHFTGGKGRQGIKKSPTVSFVIYLIDFVYGYRSSAGFLTNL